MTAITDEDRARFRAAAKANVAGWPRIPDEVVDELALILNAPGARLPAKADKRAA